MKAHMNSVGESIKQLRMPTPQEVKENYVNSGFHKQFSQPLAVRTRVEEVDIQHQREMMTKRKTPTELSQMNHPLDIPFPKIKIPAPTKTNETDETDQESADKSRLYNTLPRSWRQQNIVTSSRPMDNQEEAAQRQELVKTKSPAQLAEFNSIADFPLPTRVKQILSPSERKIQAHRQRKLSVSSSRWKFGTLFGSGGDLKRTQSDTNIKVRLTFFVIRIRIPIGYCFAFKCTVNMYINKYELRGYSSLKRARQKQKIRKKNQAKKS